MEDQEAEERTRLRADPQGLKPLEPLKSSGELAEELPATPEIEPAPTVPRIPLRRSYEEFRMRSDNLCPRGYVGYCLACSRFPCNWLKARCLKQLLFELEE